MSFVVAAAFFGRMIGCALLRCRGAIICSLTCAGLVVVCGCAVRLGKLFDIDGTVVWGVQRLSDAHAMRHVHIHPCRVTHTHAALRGGLWVNSSAC